MLKIPTGEKDLPFEKAEIIQKRLMPHGEVKVSAVSDPIFYSQPRAHGRCA
jgi:hypothetical protein